MSSLLKTRIEAFENNAFAQGHKVVDYFMRLWNEYGNGETVKEFYALACAEDDNDFWELLCKLDQCDKNRLSKEIGVKLEFVSATTCHIKYSGE